MATPKPIFRPNPEIKAKWREGIAQLAHVMKKDNPAGVQDLVKKSARRVVKNIADVTPPATGKADGSAKKRGEEAILADLLKLAIPTTVAGTSKQAREVLASAQDLLEAHEASRTDTGRVNPRNRKKLFLSQTAFNQAYRTLSQRVGWLAAALNAAAERLGFSLPAWIKRHGKKYGAIHVNATDKGISIRIIQNVPFADDVKGYARRWEFAFVKEYKVIFQQAKIIWEKEEAKIRAKLLRRK